jgi:hypothetical protein
MAVEGTFVNALSLHFQGRETLDEAIEAGIAFLKSGKCANSVAVRQACQAIAIGGSNGTTCPIGLLVPCMTNKVIRNHKMMGNITQEVMEAALIELPRCENTACPNHCHHRAEAPTEEELRERGTLIRHSDYYPWE